MKRISLLIVILAMVSMLLPGCFLSKSGGSNPVGPLALGPAPVATAPVDIATSTVDIATAPVDIATSTASVASGTCTVSFVIAGLGYSPSVRPSMRSSTVTSTLSAPYASATLYVDDVIAQRKSAPVVNGSVTLTFTGVQDTGTAKLDLELVGCSVNGASFFTGSSVITQNTTIVLAPYPKPGSNRTADGLLLVPIGIDNQGKITFNDEGQPIGFDWDGFVTNYETGERIVKLSDLVDEEQDKAVNHRDLAWYNGKLYIGGGYVLTEVDPVTKEFTFYGDKTLYFRTVDGSDLSEATFKIINDMQVHNSSLYLYCDYDQIVRMDGTTFHTTDIPFLTYRFSVLDNGDLWAFHYWRNDIPCNVRIEGSAAVEVVEPIGLSTTSAISYKDGILFAAEDHIFYWDGTKVSMWLSKEAIGWNVRNPLFFIYKNQFGQIYICSERADTIWKVQ